MKKISLITLILITAITSKAFAVSVIPYGKAVGIVVNSDGLIVCDTAKITDENGHSANPAHDAGIRAGDIITAVNGTKVTDLNELSYNIDKSTGVLNVTIKRKNKSYTRKIKPAETKYGKKLGIILKDNTAGIGTITFINPETGTFAGLGHGISDFDTNDIIPVKTGNILNCKLNTPTIGKSGEPGELNGEFENISMGIIYKNTDSGIFGKTSFIPELPTVEVAKPEEITNETAYIMTETDSSGIALYEIKILKTNPDCKNGKDMIIEITDDTLLEKTGGIVQGMSGSPILQNGRIVGAVTHVFVNDPTRGYGIFIENMLAEAEKLK